ncbi:chorismate-binding protein [Porifericola rhodea]|uniref:chorismate-binding protein n=1 Tax=Porifericola rhodea TaxID=930972 RepID=UPI0026650F7F|nr:chorismate-binding protein [Porifericola rhodea]WKN31040.1 chorismate-binding protein [Porifericola rhodea]
MENATKTEALNSIDTQQIFSLFLDISKQRHYPIAAWKLPEEDKQHIIMDTSGEVKEVSLELENMFPGFVVSPFAKDYTQPEQRANYIHADLHFDSVSRELHAPTTPRAEASNCLNVKEEVLELLAKNDLPATTDYHVNVQVLDHYPEMKHQDFVELVELAKQQIAAHKFKKVVPSRCQYIQLPDNFNIATTFMKMCIQYPHAFVSAIAMPGLGTWIGASPEILVSTFVEDGKNIFKTMALAGTQKLDGDDTKEAVKNAAWRSKEIEEQAMVSRYIINSFKKIRLREFDEDGPHTVAAGNLLHLRTDFSVDMEQVNFPELGSVMLKLLHPTSAVCGLPKEPALDFLKAHEKYDRGLFAGFLGPVNIEDQIQVFVNLRCMQLLEKEALVYAGAGVTADSDAEKEWLETSLKMQTLQKILY